MEEENKIIYEEAIGGKIKEIKIDGDTLFLVKDGGEEISISHDHEQDCCENVYADIEAVIYHKEHIIGEKFEKLVIKEVTEIGFLLCLEKNNWSPGIKILVPCYNEQNGFYGRNLDLIVNGKKIDISHLVEDI